MNVNATDLNHNPPESAASSPEAIASKIDLVREAKAPLQTQIADQLARLIHRGTLAESDQLPTHRTLAEALGISPLTVSRAYGLLESRGLIVQRQGRGTHVQVDASRGGDVVLLLPEWRQIAQHSSVAYSYHQFMAGIEQACQEHGLRLRLMTIPTSPDALNIEATLDRIRDGHHGVLTVMDTHEVLLDRLAQEGFPAVLYHRLAASPHVSNCRFNWTDALYMATTHLIQQGRQRIGYIGPYKQDIYTDEGFRGYFNALTEHGLPIDPKLWVRCSNITREPSCRKEISQMIEDHQFGDAIVCHASSACEIGSLCLQLLHQHGVRVPQDVAVVGFDEPRQGPQSDPALTWAYVPRFEIGHAAVHVLRELMKYPSQTPIVRQVDARLVVGQSCGAPQATQDHDMPMTVTPLNCEAELELVGI